MQDQHRAGQRGPEGQPGAGSGRRAPARGALGLPAWGSFPAADRNRLVSVLLQLARRQVEARPVSSRQKA
jgi:hypothetical protein